MSKKILVIEILSSLTKIVEMDYQTKKPRIYNVAGFETPSEMLTDGMVRQSEAFRDMLRNICFAKGIKTDKVIFSINSNRIVSREVTIPLVNEGKIAEIIKANASEYFPVDTSNYDFIHTVVEKNDKSLTERNFKISVSAIPKDLINCYSDFAEFCGLHLMGFDYVGNSIFKLVKSRFVSGVNVVLKIEDNSSLVTIISDGKIALQRPLAYGIDSAIETIMESSAFKEKLSYLQALDLVRKKTCVRRQLDITSEKEDFNDGETNVIEFPELRGAVTESFRSMISNIMRVIDYYTSRNTNQTISSIEVIGIGAEFSGLCRLLTNEFNQKVVALTQIDGIITNRTFLDETFSLSEFAACIGAGIAPASVILEKDSNKFRLNDSKIGIIVLSAAIIGCIGITIFSAINYASLQNQKSDLQTKKASLASAEVTYQSYMDIKTVLDNVKTTEGKIYTPTQQMSDFFTELEAKMPTEINVMSMNVSGTAVGMNVTVSSKEAAAKVIMQLRTIKSLTNISVTNISDIKDDSGKKSVSFSLNADYTNPAQKDSTAQDSSATSNSSAVATDSSSKGGK